MNLRTLATIISNEALCGAWRLTVNAFERLWQPLQIWLMASNDDSDFGHFSTCKKSAAGQIVLRAFSRNFFWRR